MSVLSDEQLQALVSLSGLVQGEGFAVQPAGIDLTVARVERFCGPGRILPSGAKELPKTTPVPVYAGMYHLTAGEYLLTYGQRVELPVSLMGLLLPRSSLLRCGVSLQGAVWDPGYQGTGQGLLTVHNPHGFELAQGARVGQLIFLTMDQSAARGYRGSYQEV